MNITVPAKSFTDDDKEAFVKALKEQTELAFDNLGREVKQKLLYLKEFYFGDEQRAFDHFFKGHAIYLKELFELFTKDFEKEKKQNEKTYTCT